VIVVVVNNGMYGTIRMHQEREYPGRSRNARRSVSVSAARP
jgi:acetolactate synthase I/II/III large subunit